ncbi:MAG: hypothetical protein ACR5LG_11445 [Sodalis sp. (in: enterobacteria)]
MFPLGAQLRILPNHTCATGAQHTLFYACDKQGFTSPWAWF